MRRLMVCLPLCLVPVTCAPTTPTWDEVDRAEEPAPLAKVADDGKALPKEDAMVRLARTDPIAFLEKCIVRYDREVKGYHCTLLKQERLKGKLQPTEKIVVDFREKPFSVRMEWPGDQNKSRPAYRTLYVRGENDNKLVARKWERPAWTFERDPEGADVLATTRYPPTEFGIQVGTRRALAAWQAAKKRGELEVVYEGEKKLVEVGNRPCWVLKRVGYKKPEDDGILETTFYFDKENWLQVGSVLKGAGGQLIGSYYFRDLKLNPKFAADTFTREGLKR
jgi:hypothetical protein